MSKKNICIYIISLLIVSICFISFHKTKVNIAYMVDSKYLPYAMVSINSAIINKNKNSEYNIHIIAKDFTEKDIKKIKQMEQAGIKINIHQAEEKDLDYPRLGRFSSFKISLQKLFIAEYLNEIKKVLYLDADTLIQEDLSNVYNKNIKNQYIAATKDGLMYQHPEHIMEIDLDKYDFYFNSGVMLLNLDKIRKDEVIRRAIIYFNTHNEIFGDQDVLNVVYSNKIKPLSYRYNCNSTFFEEKDAEFLSKFFGEKVANNPIDTYKNAAILHFAGHKPWGEYFNHSYLKPLWQQYAKDTKIKYQIVY